MNQRMLYILVLFFCVETVFAQHNPQPYFRNYNTEDGLPSPEVYVAFEDSQGFMWFGTDNGVARFNGYEFKTYGPKEGLMSNVVFDIHEDGKGRLWFGTMNGKAYILENDTVTSYKYNPLLKGFMEKSHRAALAHIDDDGKTYFEFDEYGVVTIDPNGIIDTILATLPHTYMIFHKEGFERSIDISVSNHKKGNVKKFSRREAKERFYFAEVILDKFQFKKKLHRFKNFNSEIFSAQKLKSGELLIKNFSQINYLKDSNLIWQIPFYPNIIEIVQPDSNSIWLCLSKGEGLHYYHSLNDLKNKRSTKFLEGFTVTNLLKDSKVGYWITTKEKGIYYSPDFEILNYDKKLGLSGEFVRDVHFTNDDELVIGMDNGNIYRVEPENGKVDFLMKNSKVYHNSNLYYNKETKEIYSGFSKWKNGEWSKVKAWNKFLNRFAVTYTRNAKKVEKFGKEWLIASWNSGFMILDQVKEEVIFNSISIRTQRTYDTHLDSKKNLWLGTDEGILNFDFADSSYTSPKITHPAFHSRVEDISELPDSTLAFATKGYGVMLWKDDYYRQISDEDGLTSNMLEDLYVDEKGTLWAGTLNGLNKITFDSLGNLQVRTFTTQNGLPSNEIYQIKSKNGQVWLATGGGLVKFHEQPENKDSPAPILQSIEVNDEERKALATNDFSHEENNFEFHYLAVNYRMNGKIPYRYRLNETEDWEYTQTRTVNYPSLPAGDYAFEVQAQNEDRYWSESTTFEFCVLPPWWATTWFRLLVVGVLGCLGYSYYRYRIGLVEKENQIQKQITDLEKSALQAQMNPHFIFNCLNSIQNFILQNDKKKAVEYLSRFAKLVRHNLNASVNGTISIDEEINLLENYLALEQQRFEGKFDYEIIASETLKDKYMEFPPMLIQPYVENAIIHGVSDISRKGKIEITFSEENDLLSVNIKDNGKGFAQKNNPQKKHKSVGMTITKKRLALLEQNSNTPVQINTLVDKENNPNGTEVIIQITTKK